MTNFSVGQRVVAANSAPCERCFFCLRGLQNLCEDLLFNNGAYAEYIRIPARIVERNTYEIPARVDYYDAALVEPLACVVRGFEESAPLPRDTMAIIGLGPIGLMFVKLAKLHGCRVLAVGRRRPQLERAGSLGADELITASDGPEPVKAIRDLTGGRGADVILEMLANVNLAADLKLLATNGRVIVIGNRGEITINPRDLMLRRASARGFTLWAITPAEETEIHAGLIAGLENGTLRPVVGKELPLAEAARAHKEILEPGAAGKIVLVP